MMLTLKQAFRQEMKLAKTAYSNNDYKTAMARFERAHILGQRYFWRHFVSHVWMLRLAFRQSDAREVFGQVTRLVATVPGYLFGWIPVGNTGGANVSPVKPMPIPVDLQPYFKGYSVWRGVAMRLAGFAILGSIFLTWQ